jgi:hypothetical protein
MHKACQKDQEMAVQDYFLDAGMIKIITRMRSAGLSMRGGISHGKKDCNH